MSFWGALHDLAVLESNPLVYIGEGAIEQQVGEWTKAADYKVMQEPLTK